MNKIRKAMGLKDKSNPSAVAKSEIPTVVVKDLDALPAGGPNETKEKHTVHRVVRTPSATRTSQQEAEELAKTWTNGHNKYIVESA